MIGVGGSGGMWLFPCRQEFVVAIDVVIAAIFLVCGRCCHILGFMDPCVFILVGCLFFGTSGKKNEET